MKKYKWIDSHKNEMTIIVNGEVVRMHNQHHIVMSLSNVGFMITNANGTVAQSQAVKKAAIGGLNQLRQVTKLNWIKI